MYHIAFLGGHSVPDIQQEPVGKFLNLSNRGALYRDLQSKQGQTVYK